MSFPSGGVDVAVVGAGPAGSIAARRLALMGHRVVLLDRRPFPRRKVCGGCVGPSALALIAAEGLAEPIERLGGHRLDSMDLVARDARASIPLRGNLAVSRRSFDAALTEAALRAGADFEDGCRARLTAVDRDWAWLETDRGTLSARVVVDATGLAGGLHGGSAVQRRALGRNTVDARSRIGAGAVYPPGALALPAGTLRMVVAEAGYVGLVRVEDGSINVAAAIDPAVVSEHGLREAMLRLLRRAGAEAPSVPPSRAWTGTPALTRAPASVAMRRVFRIGDAAGYVEPFTGEGMAWAIEAAVRVTRYVDSAVSTWRDDLATSWATEHARTIGRSRRVCRWLARGLRSERLVRWALVATARSPRLASPIVWATSRGRPLATFGVAPSPVRGRLPTSVHQAAAPAAGDR